MNRIPNLTNSINQAPINPMMNMTRETIGFKREGELTPTKVQDSAGDSCSSICVYRAEVDSTILSVVKSYMLERASLGYRDGPDQALLIKIDKIFTKYFDSID